MTCIKKRLRIAYENIAFYGNKTWINDCVHYTRMNQELYARECKIQESEWTELVVRRPRTVQDVIPNSKLAVYHNACEYNASRELSYRPTLSFDITFHYPCVHRHSAYNEPWMLPEVEELFMMHTCVDTFNFLCYKRLGDLPNLDFIDAEHSDDFCCQLDAEEDFHEISPLLEDMFDRTPGQPCIPEVERADAVIPPLYKVTTLDEMLMKMKLRFGNIRQIWSVSKGGTCPDRAMRVFKSPFKSSFAREKHHFDIRGIEMFTIFPHGKDARRLRSLREIRSIQKLAEAIKDFKKSLKQIKHIQSITIHQQHHHNNSQDTSAPSLASEEATTSSAMPTARRLYSDVVQGLSSINKAPPSTKSDYYSTEYTSTPTNSSARESYISISSRSSSPPSSFQCQNTTPATRSPTPPISWTIPAAVAIPLVQEGSLNQHSQHSIASSSYRTQSTSSDAPSLNNNQAYSVSLQRSNSTSISFPSSPQSSFANMRLQQPTQTPANLQPPPHQQQLSSSNNCFYSNSYATSSPNNATISFCPATGTFYHQSVAAAAAAAAQFANYSPQQGNFLAFRNNPQQPQPNPPVQTRPYQNQTAAVPTSNGWILTPQHAQFAQQNVARNNAVISFANFTQPYLMVPQGPVVKTNNQRWPQQQQPQQQQQYNQRPQSISIAPPTQQQPQQVFHQNTPAQALWNQQLQGAIFRATPSPPQPQIIIEEPKRKPQPQQPQCLSRKDSNLAIPSCSTSKPPTSILLKPNNSEQRKVGNGSTSSAAAAKPPPEENGAVQFFRGGIVITARSEDLERQALEEYHPSNETFLNEIERQAEEQYESSSENWPSPPSNDIDFVIDFQSRGAFVMSFLIV